MSSRRLISATIFVITFSFSCSNPSTNASKPGSYPKFENRTDTLIYCRELMQFIASKADWGIQKNAYCDEFWKIPENEFSPDRYIEIFENNECVTTCGLNAKIMTDVLAENGIEAFTYNYGFSGTRFTHVIVLVKHNSELYIFDPYYNAEIVDFNDQHIDVREFISQINSNLNYKILSTPLLHDLVVDFNAVDTNYITDRFKSCADSLWTRLENIGGRTYRLQTELSYQQEQLSTCSDFLTGMELKIDSAIGIPDFYQGLGLKIGAIQGNNNSHEVDSIIDSAILQSRKNNNW